MTTKSDSKSPDYVSKSGYKYTRLVIESDKSHWQGCNPGDAEWVDIEPPTAAQQKEKPLDTHA